MFGLGIGKLLVLALIVLAVWYGFKWIGRGAGAAKDAGDSGAAQARLGTQDLVPCAACGTYVPASPATCPSGRNDCPLLVQRD